MKNTLSDKQQLYYITTFNKKLQYLFNLHIKYPWCDVCAEINNSNGNLFPFSLV